MATAPAPHSFAPAPEGVSAAPSSLPPLAAPPRTVPALLLSACASGQGKTLIAAALAHHHRRQGRQVRVFKTGPDFLDPTILAHAARTPVAPLDLWMVGEAECRRKLYQAAGTADVILIEGALGLHDGAPSSADLAVTFGVPVAVVIDARGMGQTFGALALGLAHYRPTLRCAGALANRVGSTRHESLLRAGLPETIPFLGALPTLPHGELPRRHLGLLPAAEIADLDARLDAVAAALASLPIAAVPAPVTFQPAPALPPPVPTLAGYRIAIAHDEAFGFLYPDNVRVLEEAGAQVQFFSPLHDHTLEADAIYLPGGYPELHLAALAANHGMRRALRDHAASGRPLYAECGGMLYLFERLRDTAGHEAPLLGILPGTVQMQPRLAGLGLQSLRLPTGCLRGHTFHYSTVTTPLVPSAFGQRHADGRPGEPFYTQGAVRASYLHLYFPSAPAAAAALFR